MSPKAKSAAVLVATFVLGGAAGAFGMQAYHRMRFARELSGPPARARMHFRMEAMSRQLDLTRDQKKRIEAIFKKHESEFHKALHRCAPALAPLRAKVDSEIRTVLDAKQRKKFDAYRAAFAKRHGLPPPPAGSAAH